MAVRMIGWPNGTACAETVRFVVVPTEPTAWGRLLTTVSIIPALLVR